MLSNKDKNDKEKLELILLDARKIVRELANLDAPMLKNDKLYPHSHNLLEAGLQLSRSIDLVLKVTFDENP